MGAICSAVCIFAGKDAIKIKELTRVSSFILIAEYIASNPYMCASTLNGNGVVVAHSGRKYTELLVSRKVFLLYFFKKVVHCGKFLFNLLLVTGVACHTHQAVNLNVFKFSPRLVAQHLHALFGCETEFALFLGNVNLQQAGYCAPVLCPLPVDLFQQLVAVYAVYKVYERGYVFNFVALQVTYEMPLYIARQSLVLYNKVLRLALAKVALSHLVCRLNSLNGVIFRHSNQRHLLRKGGAYPLNIPLYVAVIPHNGIYPQLGFRLPTRGCSP